MTYFSILADFQNSGANVQKLCFYLLIALKDLLDRFAILSDHSQTSRISLGVFNIFITFCVDRWQLKMLEKVKTIFFWPSWIFIQMLNFFLPSWIFMTISLTYSGSLPMVRKYCKSIQKVFSGY